MMRALVAAVAMTAAMSVSAGVAAAPKNAVAARDWTKSVVATPEGGFRMGNPNAPLKLIEYGSLTCPHCAHFSKEAMPALLSRIRSGGLSFEYRSLILNAPDLAASVLSRCGGPANFFRLNSHFFAAQPQWLEKLRAVPQAEFAKLGDLPPQQLLPRLSGLGGFEAVAAKGGLPPAQSRRCLADPEATKPLLASTEGARALKIRSTPSFLINGKLAEGVHDWAKLEPLLRQPGG